MVKLQQHKLELLEFKKNHTKVYNVIVLIWYIFCKSVLLNYKVMGKLFVCARNLIILESKVGSHSF